MDIENNIPWNSLVMDKNKLNYYPDETFSRTGWSKLQHALGKEALRFLHEYTFLIVKPESLKKRYLEQFIDLLSQANMKIVAYEKVKLSRLKTQLLWQYQWNAATVDRIGVNDLIGSKNDSLLLILKDLNWKGCTPASIRIHNLKGSSRYPEKRTPNQIRSVINMTNRVLTYIHAPDEPGDFLRELSILLSPFELNKVLESMNSKRLNKENLLLEEQNTQNHTLDLDNALLNDQLFTKEDKVMIQRSIINGTYVSLEALREIYSKCVFDKDYWDFFTIASHIILHDIPGKKPTVTTLAMPEAKQDWSNYSFFNTSTKG